jgi:hypothetical protein
VSTARHLADEDESRECAVLTEVLRLHPTNLAVSELVQLMAPAPSDSFGEVDSWKRAIRELCRCGLLRREGETVAPTIAAVRFSELFEAP